MANDGLLHLTIDNFEFTMCSYSRGALLYRVGNLLRDQPATCLQCVLFMGTYWTSTPLSRTYACTMTIERRY
jgi:hypothetical protein